MEESIRERTQRLEAELLSPRAALSGKTRGGCALRKSATCERHFSVTETEFFTLSRSGDLSIKPRFFLRPRATITARA